MSDDRDILRLLNEGRPEGPRPDLREKVLAAARDARRRERRWWGRVLASAAVWLVIVVTGAALEHRESARTAALVHGSRESAAQRDAEFLARELRDIPGAEALARRMLLARAEPAPSPFWGHFSNIDKE